MATITFQGKVKSANNGKFEISFDFGATSILEVNASAFAIQPDFSNSGIQELTMDANAKYRAIKQEKTFATFFSNDAKDITGNSPQGKLIGIGLNA
jgi:hypothetical protein